MKLFKAYLCISCEEIFENKMICPSCSSTVIVPLSKWIVSLSEEELNRIKQEELNEERS